MQEIRRQLVKIPLIRFLASMKISVICLGLLFVLTLWGTIAQVQDGLYLAQVRFFNSMFFTIAGYIPFPGARLVLWVLCINLICAALIRLVYRWKQVGIIITHIGLLLFFVGAFITFHFSQEANLTLLEGQGSNVARAYHDWELAVWEDDPQKELSRAVSAYTTTHASSGTAYTFEEHGFVVVVDRYYANGEAYLSVENDSRETPIPLNGSGIQAIKELAFNKEAEQNMPAGEFVVVGPDDQTWRIFLYGGEGQSTSITMGARTIHLMLQRKRLSFPFILRLKDFRMENHANTSMARSYESLVEVVQNGVVREVLISMNQPLRYKNFTFYQASYAKDEFGRELSTLAVVKNTGRLLPYMASLLTSAGLLLHLLLMAFGKIRVGR